MDEGDVLHAPYGSLNSAGSLAGGREAEIERRSEEEVAGRQVHYGGGGVSTSSCPSVAEIKETEKRLTADSRLFNHYLLMYHNKLEARSLKTMTVETWHKKCQRSKESKKGTRKQKK